MNNVNTNTYEIEHEMLHYATNLSKGLSRPNTTLVYHMTHIFF